MGWLGALFTLFGSSADSADAAWPALPKSGFITGRAANETDLKRGDAVFLTVTGGKPDGAAAPIRIPQYGLLVEKNGKRRPVVVVQAETNERGTFLGMRDANAETYVATEGEVLLLGSAHP